MRRSSSVLLLLAPLVAAGVGLGSTPAAAAPQVPAAGRVSVTSAETQAADDSRVLDVSDDGRFVLFSSEASNLVAGDTNGQSDVFLRDTVAGTTTRVSIGDAEQEASAGSAQATMSDDGLRIVFTSSSSGLVADDTNSTADSFLRDRAAGTTTRVSIGDGEEQANGASIAPSISGDGNVVAFASDATNLVTGDGNAARDVFVRDLTAGTTIRASVSATEGESNGASNSPHLDEDGDVVMFDSVASDLIGINDTNGVQDVYARQVTPGNTFRVSVGIGGVQGTALSTGGEIDDSGSRFVFSSFASNLVAGDANSSRDVFFRSIVVGEDMARISVDTGGADANDASNRPTLSGDARFVAFSSEATDLVAGDTNGVDDVFLHDRDTATTTLVSARPGVVVDGNSDGPVLMASGSVAFESGATNLVAGDTNGSMDVFLAGEVCDGRVVTVDRNHGDVPTAIGDVILGTAGNDVVNGLAGGDRFCGGNGSDTFTGGTGNDRAFGGPGVDVLKGLDGNDRLDGAGGNDRLLGGNQNDSLFGVAGDDTLEGGNGNDTLDGGANRDTCRGQAGSDRATACEVRTGFP